MKSIAFSHIGKRSTNQDVISVQQLDHDTYLYLVVDGMGGYEKGEIAAKLVAESVFTFLSHTSEKGEMEIQQAINKANLVIKQFKQTEEIKSGATIGGVLMNAERAKAFWVGDVKIFHFRNDVLLQESNPHNLMNEVISNGAIENPDQVSRYKHVVTRSIQGDVKSSQVEFFEVNPIKESDLLVICSDGVHDIIDGLGLQHVMNKSNSLEIAIGEIESRLKKEAKDNYSLVTAQIGI